MQILTAVRASVADLQPAMAAVRAHMADLRRKWAAAPAPGSPPDREKEEKEDRAAVPPAGGLCAIGRLPGEVAALALSFADGGDVDRFGCASTDARSVVREFAGPLWGALVAGSGATPPRQRFLEERLARAQAERRHWRGAGALRGALAEYERATRDREGVVGLLCDLGMVRDAGVARALSRRRWQAMVTTVVRGSDTIMAVKKRMPAAPLSFFPVHAGSERSRQALAEQARGELPDYAGPGFLGYAVDLIQLRPEHEHLRLPVFFALFRDMAVFETEEQAAASGLAYTVAVDAYSSSTGGDSDSEGSGSGSAEEGLECCFPVGQFRSVKGDGVEESLRAQREVVALRTSVAWARYS